MKTITRSIWQRCKSFLTVCKQGSPILVYVTLGAGVLMLFSLAMQTIDTRTVTGAPAWAKPAKFGASVLVTGLSLAWIFSRITPWSRGMRRAANVFSAMLVAELLLITFQAARAVPSHFNTTTITNALIFQSMGVAITAFWITQVWLTVKSFRYRFVDSTIGAGIKLGLLISTLGGGLGFVMTAGPTASQAQAMRLGQASMVGAHTVGAPDGGPGMPVTRWSTVAGDLRVPHFVGLHALQLLPLFAWAMSRRRQSAGVVNVVGASFGGLVVVTLIQALRGSPLFAPDSLTIGLYVFVFAVMAAGARAVSRQKAGSENSTNTRHFGHHTPREKYGL